MSTRSAIGKVSNTGEITAVYCHYDGYPEGVGACLAKCHNCTEDAEHIIELGSLSSLNVLLDPINGVEHNFDNPCDVVTVAYHRDGGEKLQDPVKYYDVTEFIDNAYNDMDAEYVYLWVDHRWKCWNTASHGTIDLYKNL